MESCCNLEPVMQPLVLLHILGKLCVVAACGIKCHPSPTSVLNGKKKKVVYNFLSSKHNRYFVRKCIIKSGRG